MQVLIPSLPSFDPWARVVGLGAASSRGFVWIPQTGDEVLVAFNENDERDAYIIGGLWSMVNRPPLTAPTDFLTKRVIQTGLGSAPGHIVEFDDALQSVSITTSTSQKIVMDPTTVAISAFKDTAKLTIAVGPPPSITIESTSGDISLKAPLGTISLEAADVDISGTKRRRSAPKGAARSKASPSTSTRRVHDAACRTRGRHDGSRDAARARTGKSRCDHRQPAGVVRRCRSAACPLVNGVQPHVGGVVTMASLTVSINGFAAARQGDVITEAGGPNTIAAGCPTVSIGG